MSGTNLIAYDPDLHKGVAIDYALMKASSTDTPLCSEDDICAFWNISREQLLHIKQDPEFIKAFRSAALELKKSGEHLAGKARLLLEHFMDREAPAILYDRDISVTEREKILSTLLKISGIESRNKAVVDASAQQSSQSVVPTLNIVLTTPTQVSVEKVLN